MTGLSSAMWNMLCDVMPTISEDSISQRSSQFGDDANFEQLMVSMLDERDKLVDSLKNEQEKTGDLEGKVKDLEKERDSLQRQLNQNLPQVLSDLLPSLIVFLFSGVCHIDKRIESSS